MPGGLAWHVSRLARTIRVHRRTSHACIGDDPGDPLVCGAVIRYSTIPSRRQRFRTNPMGRTDERFPGPSESLRKQAAEPALMSAPATVRQKREFFAKLAMLWLR